MEIKVKCTCGSVYAFEETPVDGCVQFPVHCSNCGADGTDQANAYITAKMNGGPDPSAATAERPKGLLKFFKKPKTDELDETTAAPLKQALPEDSGDETSPARLAMAGTAALAVGALGAVGWMLLTRATGFEFGYVAWGIGVAIGFTSRLLAPRGHHLLGLTAAVAALIAICGGQALSARSALKDVMEKVTPLLSEAAISYAKQAVVANTDDEVRQAVAEFNLASKIAPKDSKDAVATFQGYQAVDIGMILPSVLHVAAREPINFSDRERVANPALVTQEQIDNFKTKVVPDMQAFINGKPSREEYAHTLAGMIVGQLSFKDLFIVGMSAWTFLWIFLGVGSAFRVARNAGLKY